MTATWEEIDTSAQSQNGEFTIKLRGGEKAIFNDLPAGTSYEVWEETETGWKLIKVVDSEGVIQPTEISAAEFTNEYVEIDRETKQSLGATKMLKDENGEETAVTAGQFRFRLYDSDGNLLQTVSNDDRGNISFDELTFTDTGTYTYTIREVEGSDESIDYASDEPITATIVVREKAKLDDEGNPVKDDEGNPVMELVADEPTYSPNPAQFVNQKIIVKHVSHTLSVEKIAEGVSADNSPTFTFEVTLTEGNGKPLEAGTVVTVNGEEKTLSAGGKITVTISEFDENGKGSVDIEGLPEGTLYSVKEIDVPRGWAMTEIDGEGTLSGDESVTSVSKVTNKYEVSGLVKLEAEKKFEGGDITDGQFEFGLYADAACTEQLQVAANGVLDETKGTAKVVFAPLTVDRADTYTYYIKEIVPSEDDPAYDETIQYSDEVITATVVATDTKHNGTLDVEVTYDPEGALLTNTKKPGKLAINKEVLYAGADKANTAFPIVISLTDDNGVALEGSYPWTSDRAGVEGGTVASGDELQIHGDETITIDGLPEGAKYEVIEGEVEDFTLTDSENTEGDIVSNETATAKLVNTFIMGTAATLEAHKTLKGGKLVAGAFTFQLLDSDGNVISEATNDDGGNVTFDELSYGFADADKTFTYTIKEEAKDTEGVVYDSTEYGATVSVTKTAAGKLEAEVAYNKGDEEVELPEFVNTYTAAGSYTPIAFKSFRGHDLAKGQFTFKVSRPNGAPLSSYYNPGTETDDEGNQNVIPAVVELTAINDANGKVVFDPIMFTQDDAGKTITYIVTEVDDQQEGTTYDEHSYRIDVTVADNGDGTLSTSAKSYVDGKPVDVDTEAEKGRGTFYNTYHEPAEGEIKVEKVLDGLDWSDNTQFTFTLTADKGNPDTTAIPETKSLTIDKSTASHIASFGTFKINKAGSYRYYVQETRGNIRGLEYDATPHTVDINVIEDADGNLVAAEGSQLVVTEAITNYTPDKPGFEKKIADVNDSTEDALPKDPADIDEAMWVDSADHDLGDVIPFRLKATLPDDIATYKQYGLTFEDQMESGLSYNGDAKVCDADGNEIDGAKVTATESGFTATATWGSADEGAEFLPTELAGDAVYVYFTATLEGDGVKYGAEGNMNAARLTYSYSPSTGATDTTGWDNVIAFTYKVDVTKTDQTGAAAEAVGGAEFTLEKVVKGGDNQVVASDVKAGEGNVFSFAGLDDGTYVLRETKVPDGYRKADDITFEVEASHTAKLDGWDASVNANDVTEPARNKVLTSLTGIRDTGKVDANDINAGIKFERADEGLKATVMNDKNTTATIEVSKEFSEWGLADGFEFKLAAVTEGAPMPKEATATATKDAPATFGEITYEVPGTYEYTITETDSHVPGVTYDTTPHKVMVTVARDDANTLNATVSYDGKGSLTVTNAFAPARASLEVTKALTGRGWADSDRFEFALAPVGGAPMPASATAAATKAAPTATFGETEYKAPGTYEYTITETKGSLANVTYDATPHRAVVTVTADPETNALEATVAYDGRPSLTVTNAYKPETKKSETKKPASKRALAKTGDPHDGALAAGLAAGGLLALALGLRRRRREGEAA